MGYPKLMGLTSDGVVYRNEHMGTLEAMIPSGGFTSAHAPYLLELENGDLLCAWFAGSFEGNADISIVCARLPKGSDRWEKPVQVSHDPTRSEQNPSLFLAPNREVWLMYTAQESRVEGKDNMQFTSIIRRQRSSDGGRTWSKADVMFDRKGSFSRQAIQVLSNGRWIFGNWLCSDSPTGLLGDPTVFQISDDSGKTWRTVQMPNSSGRVHANVVEVEPGYLVAFMRSRAADAIYRSESRDFGDSWTEPIATVLPNNNSSISAIKLNSGRLAIAYNPTKTPIVKPDQAAWPGLRCPVAVALSEDGGNTWPMIRHMELGEGFVGSENSTNNLQYEYPCLIQTTDGTLHLAFAYRSRLCIKWMSFTEQDVMGAKREAFGLYNPTSAKVE
ncbi:MAG: sialidase family protein [Eubacteriales bacterium]|jgi:predicted neuraminidase